MAGDWIKLAHTTPDKPEISQMAADLGLEPEQVVGHLIRVWIWADQQSLNGHALNVTMSHVDRISRHAGVASALKKVGWLRGEDGALSFPKFDRHNGKSAKKRELAAERKRKERSRDERDESVTREEREKNKRTTSPLERDTGGAPGVGGAGGRGVGHALDVTELPDEWRAFCVSERPDLNPDAAWRLFVDHWAANRNRPEGKKADWLAAWRNWVRKERRGGPAAGSAAVLQPGRLPI